MFHVKHAELAGSLCPETAARLEGFLHLLDRWNARVNLVSRADRSTLWQRHVLDSVQLAPLLPSESGEIIDLGSGAGFPGLILAILTGRHVHLVEADRRKAAFLREAVRATAANAIVHARRAEHLALPLAGVVTARALAPLSELLSLAAPLMRPDGICLFPKGQSAEDELTAAARGWHMRVERFPSRTCVGASLLRISEIRRAGHPA